MRLVRTVLFVALTGAGAAHSLADDAKPADPKPEVTKKKVPYRVVKMLPETGQVLLFDKNQGTHVVAEVGQSVDGYLVEDIDDDEVTLVAESGAQIILTSPPPAPRVAKRTTATRAEPVDPYVPDTSDADDPVRAAAPGPVDPYAEPDAPSTPGEGGVRVASAADPSAATTAPVTSPGPPPPVFVDTAPGASAPSDVSGIAAFAEAVGATPDASAPEPSKPATKKPGRATTAAAPAEDAAAALASAATGAPAPTPSPSPTASPDAPGQVTIARSELDAALADFSRLASSFRATFTPDGLRFDALHAGTLLAKIGLRRGDVITYVDGQPLRSLDDAATLYARAASVKTTTLQVVRDGQLVTLRVSIR